MNRLNLKSFLIASCAFMMLLGMNACSSTEPENVEFTEVAGEDQTDDKAWDYRAIELTRSMRECNNAMNNASMKLFSKALESGESAENILVSPLSVNYVLAALVNGAEGQTRDEIMNFFGIENLEDANQLFKLYTSELTKLDNQVKLSLANSLWIDKQFFINPDYANVLNDGWPVALYSEQLNTTECLQRINTWVEDNTSGLIKDFLKKPIEGPMGVFNTVYFNGKWRYPFDKSATESATFKGVSGNMSVEMMHSERKILNYAKGENWQGVALPYGNGNFEMRLILPDEGVSPSQLSIFNDDIQWNTGYMVKTAVPKFECRYRNDKFENILKNLGINKIFSDNNDELSGILTEVNKGFALSNVIHEAVVNVDESGAVMAAATGGVLVGADGLDKDPVNIDLVFDRPFIFEVRETSTNTLIFIGVVNNI